MRTERKPRPFKGVIITGGPVTTKEVSAAGLMKTDPLPERKCKNCLIYIEDNCPESEGPEGTCGYFSTSKNRRK